MNEALAGKTETERRLAVTNILQLQKRIVSATCEETDIDVLGADSFAIHTPFTFGDGDHFVSVLRKHGERWIITDDGFTFLHLSCHDVDISALTRERIINDSRGFHGIECRDGELRLRVESEAMIGRAVHSFIHGVSKIVLLGGSNARRR